MPTIVFTVSVAMAGNDKRLSWLCRTEPMSDSSREAKGSLANTPAALTFLTVAYHHCKYMCWAEGAGALVAVCGLAGAADDAFSPLTGAPSAQAFSDACKALRHGPQAAHFLL